MDQPLFDVPDHWWRRRRCPVCGSALSVQHAHLYVVQRQWWVKIGTTDNLRRRLSELARPTWEPHLVSPAGMDWTEPLTVLAVMPDAGAQEHGLHQRFADRHEVGEWFLPDRAMRGWLEAPELF